MRRTYSFGKRLMAMLLCIAMVAVYFPGMRLSASAAEIKNKVVDPSTIDGWEQYFGPDVISTEYTGGVWTDKSVFDSFLDYQTEAGVGTYLSPGGNGITDAVRQMLATDPQNFLIALSAITAKKSVSGSASAPMDTMLVLDVSGSMQGDNAVAMVQATNQAIEKLLEQNTNNRVGVVLYSGNHSFGNSNTATASVILPLGRYTTTDTQNITVNGQTQQIPAYLTISGSGNDQTVSVASSVNNGTNTDSKTVRGGTYIQNGLYQAWQQFNAVTDTVIPEGNVQAGTQRTPVIILMSDGAPTAATTAYNNVNTSNLGDGGDTSNRFSFMTQLTASWVRSKVQAKYNNTAPKFYTLGIGTGNSTEATSVLNPAGSNNTINGYWTNFLAGNNGQNVQIVSGRNGWSVYKDAAVTAQNYVDQYWLTSGSNGLINAFEQIVEKIVLESVHHSTLVDEVGADLSGYVTFEDELGELMEVKAVKGLTIGSMIFTGAELAKSMNEGDLGQSSDPKEYGNEFVRTVKERLGIEDTAVAQNLIRNAYHSGQLSYTSATQYSNYIGWYADAEGNYLGFWQESDGYGADAAPEGAVYINKSYGYLGAQSTEEGASDMMHVVVMVHTEIATGHQSIVYKIPASLIPAVTYHVELEGDDPSQVESITRDGADPIRLLVEVGLREDINSVNIEAKIAEHIEKGGHVHENADGTYTFYTNRWGDGDGGEVDYNQPLTHLVTESHFYPALENERYYHVGDTLIYRDASGSVYNGTAAPSGDGYFYARTYYEMVNGEPRLTKEFVPLAAVSVAKAVQGAGGWYIPAGTPHQLSRFAAAKTPGNTTGTLAYSWNPVVLHDDSGYNSYAFLGNNGSFTVEPAQGIALSKTVAETVEGAPAEFTFTVELSQAVADPLITDADGNALEGIASVSGNVITVKVQAGQTVYITGIPTGTTYTVRETEDRYYTATSDNASGTVAAYTITPVDFVNAPKGYGSLVVGKDVNYPEGFVPGTAHNSKEFGIVVEFTGGADDITAPTGAVRSGNSFALKLKDGESVTFANIPEGTGYTVSEGTVPAGYHLQELRYSDTARTIAADDQDVAEVVNSYSLQPVSANVKVQGSKTLVTNESGWGGEIFTVELFRINDFSDQEPVSTGLTATVSETDRDYEIDLSSISFTEAGTYFFRAVEVIPAERNENIAYDRTYGLFSVTVGDADADGALELQAVNAYQSTGVSGNAADGWIIEKNFTNVVTTDRIYLDIQKNVVDAADGTPVNLHRGDITFGLFTDMNAGTAPEYYMLTDTAGKATIMVPVTRQIIENASGRLVYYLREIAPSAENRVVGMHYDESWLYAVEITWDTQNNTAVLRYAPIENGTVGAYETYVEGATVFNHLNTYEQDVKVTLELSGEKTLNGGTDLGGREFSFSLYQSTAAFVPGTLIGTVENSGNTIAFGDVVFTAPGVYYMVAKENASTLGGITVDGAEYHITVEVEKFVDTDGTTRLRIVTGYPSVVKYGTSDNVGADGLDFNNLYIISGSEDVTISGHKTLVGRELIAGEFEFGLYQGSTLLQSVRNLTNGSFVFAPIAYTADDIGEHTYTVREIANGLGGVAYDTETSYTVKVTVSDDHQGGLNVTKTVNGGDADIAFTNYYSPEPISVPLSGTKTWYNEDLQQLMDMEENAFAFELYSSVAGFGTQGSLIASTGNDTSGSFGFSLSYTKAGDHYYILRESIGDAQGVSYDAGRYFIRVLVSDDGQGKLSPTVTVVKEGVGAVDAIAFSNYYTPASTTAVISGTKALEGRQMIDGEFTFELYDTEGDLLQTAVNSGTGFAFDAITYEKSGTYTYTVKEQIPQQAANGVYKGVTYDDAEYTVTVTVTDIGGSLQAQVSHTAQQLHFDNSYQGADTYFSVAGEKSLSGKTLEAGMFTFELYDKNGVRIATATNDAEGAFAFHIIPLAAAGDYRFTIQEQVPGNAEAGKLNGIYYADDVYTVTVSVTDDGQGSLVAGDPVISKGGQTYEKALFQNSYTVEPVSVPVQVSKILTGRGMKTGEFTFVIDDGEGYTEQAVNGPTGIVAFSPITFYSAGERTFTVSEIIGNAGGVSYDKSSYKITITATDNGDGTLSTEVTYPDGSPVFVNTYTVSGDASFDVSGTKTVKGRTMTQEDVFTFEMKDASGTVVATVQNQGAQFLFDDVTVSTLGEHVFTITEKAPDGGVKDGITYSTQVYTVTVNVTDNGMGGMQASAPVITYQGVDVISADFVNTYTAAAAPLDLKAEKSYEKGFEKDVFTFLLTGHGENQKKTNDAEGNVIFDTVYLDQTGSYTFTITEENSGLAWVDYDTTTYKVTLEVKDDGKGQLYVDPDTITYTADDKTATRIIFDNDYLLTPNRVVISGEKLLTRDGIRQTLAGNEFTFGLYEGGQLLQTKSNAADGSFEFDAIEYQQAGNHTYTVKEILPGERVEGMIYDETVYTVEVSVTDDDEGNLIVSKQLMDAEKILFTNTLHEIIVKDVAETKAPTVSIDGQKVAVNDVLVYTIGYTNTTGEDVTATITDILPEHTEFISASDDGICADGIVTWKLKVAKNAFKQVSVTVRVAAPQAILVNDATVYDGTNTYTSDAVYNHTVEDVLVKDVQNSQGISIDGEQVKPGDELTYVIGYFNATAEEATVTITDKLPAHTTFKSVDASGSYNGTDTVQWTLKLAPWSTAEVSFKVTVNEPDVFIDNTATALVGTNEILSNTVTNHTFEEVGGKAVALVTEPAVSIDGRAVKVGELLEYTISYTNITEVPVNVTITDRIPEYTKLLSAEGGTVQENVITWQLNDVQPREEVTVSFRVEVVGAGVKIENQAQIFDGSNKLTNTVTNSVPKKSVDKDTASTGEVLIYTIDYINTTGDAANVVITDKLDAALSYVDGTAGTGVYADGVITWNFRDVPAGERITVTFQAKVDPDTDAAAISNVAEIIENEIKIAATNETVVQVKKPALSILKEQAVGNGTAAAKKQAVKADDVVTYTITVTNSGEGDAYGITVTDKLPEGLRYVADSADNGGAVNGGVVTWKLDSLASGQSVKLTFKVTVPKVDQDTTWKNVASMVYENDPNGDEPIESDGVEIELKIPVTPQTGDGFSAILFISLMVLSSFGLAAVMVCKKREEESQTQQ